MEEDLGQRAWLLPRIVPHERRQVVLAESVLEGRGDLRGAGHVETFSTVYEQDMWLRLAPH